MQRPLSRGGSLLLGMLMAGPLLGQGPWYEKIGEGCRGTVGTPSLAADASAVPILGETFRAQISNVPDGTAIGILGVSTANWAGFELPLELSTVGMPNCLVYTDVRRTSLLTVVGGIASWESTLPSGPEWIGRSFYQQVFVFDAGANALGAVMSNAQEGVIAAPQAAPFASIAFPPPSSVTNQETVLVRGQAFDPDGVAEVRVNGLLVDTSDGYANWQLRVPLQAVDNSLIIETSDSQGHTDPAAAAVQVRKDAIMQSPRGLVFDAARNRALVADSSMSVIIAVDLQSGTRSVFSGPGQGLGQTLVSPWGITLDDPYAYVFDSRLGIVEIELSSGNRRVISNWSSEFSFHATQGIAIAGGMAYFTVPAPIFAIPGYTDFGHVREIDLQTGQYTNFQSYFSDPVDVVPHGNDLLVVDVRERSIRVLNRSTGISVILSDDTHGTGPTFANPQGIALDTDRGLVVDLDQAAINVLAVDLDSGDRTLIASMVLPEESVAFETLGITLTDDGALVTDSELSSIWSVDLQSGQFSLLTRSSFGDGDQFFLPTSVVTDGTTALVLDQRPISAVRSIISIDLDSSTSTTVADETTGTGSDISNAVELTRGPSGTYLSTLESRTIQSLDPSTGHREVVSSTTVGGGFIFRDPKGLAAGRSSLFVLDPDQQILFGVDPSTGDRSVVSGHGIGMGSNLTSTSGLALDLAGSRALTMHRNLNAIFAISLSDGNRTALSGNGIGTGPGLGSVFGLEAAGDQLLVATLNPPTVLAIDLLTGNRRAISNSQVGSGPTLKAPVDLALQGTVALVADSVLDVIFAIDLQTGERVIISM